MWHYIFSIAAAIKFRGYEPKPLSVLSASRWIKQFDRKDWRLIRRLLRYVIYLSEKRTRQILVDQNAALMKRLSNAGLSPKKLIYVQFQDAGSSSPVMLNFLRNSAQLDLRGCKFVDLRDSFGLNKVMNELAEGALIYVDDFAGTGKQFCTDRDFAAQNFVGSFAEFLLVPSVCEEAMYELGSRGIEAFAGHVHSKTERPLHPNSTIFKQEEKDRLIHACSRIDKKYGLGYGNLATMVVLYRNAPNTVPVMLRGNRGQEPYIGLFPRFADLPRHPSL